MWRRWPLVVGLLLAFPEVRRDIKWLLTWAEHFEFIRNHGPAVMDYVLNLPPPLSLFLLVVGGVLIWWDLRHRRMQHVPALINIPVQPSTIPTPDNRQWFTSYAIGNLADEELVRAANAESEEYGKLDQEYDTVVSEIVGLGASRGLIGAAGLSVAEPEGMEELRERQNALIARLTKQRPKRDASFSRARDDLYDKLQTGRLIAKGTLAPIEQSSEEVEIPAWRWRFLRFNGDFKEASGEGITYKAIAVARTA